MLIANGVNIIYARVMVTTSLLLGKSRFRRRQLELIPSISFRYVRAAIRRLDFVIVVSIVYTNPEVVVFSPIGLRRVMLVSPVPPNTLSQTPLSGRNPKMPPIYLLNHWR